MQKSVGLDGPSTFSSGAAGFDPPALTLSTQLPRYAMHRASAGGGRATSDASRRRFWAMAARTNSSWAPRGPRSLSRPSLRMRFKCANRISIFLRSRRDCSNASVPAKDRAMSRAASWMIARDPAKRDLRAALRFEFATVAIVLSRQIEQRGSTHSPVSRLSSGFYPQGSGRRRLSDHIESRCARRCRHLASTCRTQGYVARYPSPRPASSASEQPRRQYLPRAAPA